MIDNPSISVVIPVLNEEESLRKLYNEISVSLNEFTNWDIIFVDDGSDDDSGNIIQEIAAEDNRVSCIRFLKNFGKADALSEGFKLAQGDIVITMDADLQDDPKEIIPLVNKIQEGWDLVSGWKKDRKDPISKRVPSRLFNLVTRLFTGIKIHDFNCGINHRPREFGETKYTGNRFFHGFFDLFTMLFTSRYFDRPLHFFGFIGLICILVSTCCEVFPIFDKLVNGIPFQKHFALIVFGAMVFVLGLWLFSIGLLGELLIKTSGNTEKKIHSIYSSRQD